MDSEKQFEILREALAHLGDVQVQSDSINHSRGNSIVIAEGLLAVAAEALFHDGPNKAHVGLALLAMLGLLLSVSWLLFEQRNQIYFTSRGVVLEQLEERVVRAAFVEGLDFPRFWSAVGGIVNCRAKWYQRHSAPRVFRLYLPGMFAVAWGTLAVYAFACGG